MEPIEPDSEPGMTLKTASRGWGGALLGLSIAGILLCASLLLAFAAPLSLVVLALIPVALLGGWLFKRGRSRSDAGHVSRLT